MVLLQTLKALMSKAAPATFLTFSHGGLDPTRLS